MRSSNQHDATSNQHDATSEHDEALLTEHVHIETSRRIKRLAGLYAAGGIPRTSIPEHVLALIDADARVPARTTANAGVTLGQSPDLAAQTEHALLIADGKNGYRFWWGMSWNQARDTPTWWPEAA